MMTYKVGSVVATAASKEHDISKERRSSINLIEGFGVEGDCHAGKTVQHRSRLHMKPPPSNLRQIHIMSEEILTKFDLRPAELGENITTSGIDLANLCKGARLHFVDANVDEQALVREHPVVIVEGLRNPCPQIEKFRKGLQENFIVRDGERKITKRLAGVMGNVEVGGRIAPMMKVVVEAPAEFEPLQCV